MVKYFLLIVIIVYALRLAIPGGFFLWALPPGNRAGRCDSGGRVLLFLEYYVLLKSLIKGSEFEMKVNCDTRNQRDWLFSSSEIKVPQRNGECCCKWRTPAGSYFNRAEYWPSRYGSELFWMFLHYCPLGNSGTFFWLSLSWNLIRWETCTWPSWGTPESELPSRCTLGRVSCWSTTSRTIIPAHQSGEPWAVLQTFLPPASYMKPLQSSSRCGTAKLTYIGPYVGWEANHGSI